MIMNLFNNKGRVCRHRDLHESSSCYRGNVAHWRNFRRASVARFQRVRQRIWRKSGQRWSGAGPQSHEDFLFSLSLEE